MEKLLLIPIGLLITWLLFRSIRKDREKGGYGNRKELETRLQWLKSGDEKTNSFEIVQTEEALKILDGRGE